MVSISGLAELVKELEEEWHRPVTRRVAFKRILYSGLAATGSVGMLAHRSNSPGFRDKPELKEPADQDLQTSPVKKFAPEISNTAYEIIPKYLHVIHDRADFAHPYIPLARPSGMIGFGMLLMILKGQMMTLQGLSMVFRHYPHLQVDH